MNKLLMVNYIKSQHNDCLYTANFTCELQVGQSVINLLDYKLVESEKKKNTAFHYHLHCPCTS